MNARKNFRVLMGGALSASTVLLSLFLAPVSQAAAKPGAFHMVAIENIAQGKLVTQGAYSKAIRRLEPSLSRRYSFEKANNLCVAYTKSNVLDKAEKSCDAAVQEAGAASALATKIDGVDERSRSRDQAIALSNRGVFKAVSGDGAGALVDFESALKLYDELDEFHINLAYLAVFDSIENASAQNTR